MLERDEYMEKQEKNRTGIRNTSVEVWAEGGVFINLQT